MLQLIIKISLFLLAFLFFLPSLHAYNSEYEIRIEEECSSDRLFDKKTGEYIGCSSEYCGQKTIFSSLKMSKIECNRYCYNSHKDVEIPPCSGASRALTEYGFVQTGTKLCTITTPNGIEIRKQ